MKNGQLTAGLARSGARAGEESRLAEDSGAARAGARRTARSQDRRRRQRNVRTAPAGSGAADRELHRLERREREGPRPCTVGAAIPFPPSRAARESLGDPRWSLLERYGARSYFVAALRSVADRLVKERLLLPQDADTYVAAGKQAPF